MGCGDLLKWTAGLGCLGFIGLVAIVMLIPGSGVMRNVPQSPPGQGTEAPPKRAMHAGDEGMIGKRGRGNYMLAVDDASWDAMIDAQVIKDREGLALLIAEGNVLVVEAGTRCRVVKTGLTSTRVRILEGQHSPADGWIQREFVHPWVEPPKEVAEEKLPKEVAPSEPEATKPEGPPAPDPARFAASRLSIARALQKQGKRSAALEAYRKIVEDFPGSEAAKEAESRIKAASGS
jgi:hypothetical protein